jgi:protoheme IX farnesyltransferase
VAAAAGTLAAACVSAAVAFRGEPLPLGNWRDYVTLTKPRIMSLLLVTGAAGMFVGAEGVPDGGTFAAAMAGLALACGGASALNHVLDADIDRLMGARTEQRPVASGRVPAPRALEFGLVLSALSFALLASTVNVLTAVLALVGNAFYVVVYTRYLKRSTVQNIVIGGAAGAVPPLVGFAAATGNLTLPALWLFLIVFLWTPPHFWALALMIREHYARANVPMLPVARGDQETTRQILLYSVALTVFTVAVGLWLGWLYTGAAVVLGVVFLVWARASLIVFALFYTEEMPNLSGFLTQLLALENLEFLFVYFSVGLLFSAIVFAVSVISVPLMLDRNQDAISSMLASMGALARNPASMFVWAFMIVALTVIGFMSFHLGLVVLMPIVGHASWHAYRDLVEPLPTSS